MVLYLDSCYSCKILQILLIFIVGWDWLKYFSWDRDVLCAPPPSLQDHPGRGEPGPRHHGAPARHDGGQERARDSELQGKNIYCDETICVNASWHFEWWFVRCQVWARPPPAQTCVGVSDDTTHTVFIILSISWDTNYQVISLFLSLAPLQSLIDYHHVDRI